MLSTRWRDSYGGVRWYFNDVLHVPGDPIMWLFDKPAWATMGGRKELIEVEGEFFIRDNVEETARLILGEPTLETVLEWLRGRKILHQSRDIPKNPFNLMYHLFWDNATLANREDVFGPDFGY